MIMEKPINNNSNRPHKNLFLKFLPKAASAVNFQNTTTPFSPGRDHHHHHHSSTKLKSHANKGFSGPINFAALPDEARRKPTNVNGGYDSIEPTSPKVSCMGQIKCKHKHKNKNKNKNENEKENEKENKHVVSSKKSSKEKISKFFRAKNNGNKSDVVVVVHDDDSGRVMPSLGQMRKFASGRESLGNFDWKAQIAPIVDHRDCFSDEERGRDSDDDEDEDEEDREVIIPFSAPMLLGGGGGGEKLMNMEKRKEVCLWKRRTIDPPLPLSLKSTR